MSPKKIQHFFATLQAANPNPRTELEYGSPFQLLAAVLLSAQATDIGVNKVTRKLFAEAPDAQSMWDLGLDRLTVLVSSLNYYKTKARHLHQCCRQLLDLHQGEVPQDREALEALPGVGRKTANVVLNVAFSMPVFPVDTHIFRVSNRTGLAPGKTPLAVEAALMSRVPDFAAVNSHHWMILHGRYVCKARQPECHRCLVSMDCDSFPKLYNEAHPERPLSRPKR